MFHIVTRILPRSVQPKKKYSRVLAFSRKVSEGRVSYKDRQQALILAANPRILASKLQDKVFADGCRRRGFDPSQLLPRDINDFAHFNGRAATLSIEEQEFRFQEFEKERMHLLSLAICTERIHHADLVAQEESRQKQVDKFRSTLNRKLGEERDYIEKKTRNRLKEENCLMRLNAAVRGREERANKTRAKHANKKPKNFVQQTRYAAATQAKLNNQSRKQKVENKRKERAQREQALREFREARLNKKTKKAAERVRRTRLETSVKKIAASRTRLDNIQREARKQAKMRMDKVRARLDAKQAQAENARRKAKERKHMENMRRQMKNEMRRAKAERIRAAIEYDYEQVRQRQRTKDERVEALAELGSTMKNRRAKMGRANSEQAATWRRKKDNKKSLDSPGPGDYGVPDGEAHHAVQWGDSEKPPSVFDITARRAAEIPAPGDYPMQSTLNSTGGQWNYGPKPMSELDYAIKRGREKPSPSSYNPKLPRFISGVSMQGDMKKSFVDNISRRAVLQDIPSPGHRNDLRITQPRTIKELQTSFAGAANAMKAASRFKGKLHQIRNNHTV